jgi:hypothetical protein
MQSSASNSTFSSIFYGLDFLLSHLSKPEFPRTIATLLTEGKQVVVYSNIEALAYYKQADYKDCRLAAYPYIVDKKPQIIDFVMLDLDLNNFHYSRQKLDAALKKILSTLSKDGIIPTVIWTGNGYHILVPLQPLELPLEDMPEFAKFNFKDPSKYILRFLEKRLSGGKSDKVHNSTVSFGNCMLRVPYSINSKHNNSVNFVSIIQKWNGKSFPIKPLLGDFIAYFFDMKEKQKQNSNYKTEYSYDYVYKKYGSLLSKP